MDNEINYGYTLTGLKVHIRQNDGTPTGSIHALCARYLPTWAVPKNPRPEEICSNCQFIHKAINLGLR